MSKKPKVHDWQLPVTLEAYAKERGVEFKRFSPFHMRVSYDTRAEVDIWTSGKYWVKETNYLHDIVERSNEKGQIPSDVAKFLDTLLFAVEISEQ